MVQFAIAVKFDLEIALIDVKTFFLYGNLEDEVYMEQPPEWEDARYPIKDYVCRLQRSMYGLPQASHCAQMKLKDTLTHKQAFRQAFKQRCLMKTVKTRKIFGKSIK